MKKALILVGLLVISSSCFALEAYHEAYHYAEYSFDDNETSEIRLGGIYGRHDVFGSSYSFVFRWTKADIQAQDGSPWGPEIVGYLSRMLRAAADRRIFIIEEYMGSASGSYRNWGLLLIKINENEYLVFYTGL